MNEMRVALDINLEQKLKLQEMLLQMHSSKRQVLLENQIEMRNLKLEKTDLYLQNLEMKKLTQIQQQEKEQTEQKLAEMQKQLEQFQKQYQLMSQEMQFKDKLIQESQLQLQQKEQEIQMIKNHEGLNQNIQEGDFKLGRSGKQMQNETTQPTKIESHSSTVKIDFKSTLKDQIMKQCKIQSNQQAPNSARYNDQSQQLSKDKTVALNKKLILSGFFDDDFQGELDEQRLSKDMKSYPEEFQQLQSNMEQRLRIMSDCEDEEDGQTQLDPIQEYGVVAEQSNQNSVLKTKRNIGGQSVDGQGYSVHPSNVKSRKGYTPNNRYNFMNDYGTIELMDGQSDYLKASVASSLQMNFNIDGEGSLDRELCARKTEPVLIQQNSYRERETPVAQVDLFNVNPKLEKKIAQPVVDQNLNYQDEVQLYQPKIHTSNQRYQNHQPDNQGALKMAMLSGQASSSTTKVLTYNINTAEILGQNDQTIASNYESRLDQKQSNNKKSNSKRSSKLNRYLSFNRKDADEKKSQDQVNTSEISQIKHPNIGISRINVQNQTMDAASNSKYNQKIKNSKEKENNQPQTRTNTKGYYTNQVNDHNASADGRLKFNQQVTGEDPNHPFFKAFSPQRQNVNHTIDLRQHDKGISQNRSSLTSKDSFHISGNKFEQRKYSQPIISQLQQQSREKSQGSQQLHKTPQNTNARRPPSPNPHNMSGISTGSGMQSYAQIRRQSKERQQQQASRYQSGQNIQTPIQPQNTGLVQNPYSQRKPSIQNTTQDKRQTAYNSHKIDLSNQNQNKQKASAAASISKYGPIKPTHAQNQLSQNGGGSFVSNGTNDHIQPINNPGISNTSIGPQAFGIGQTYFENFIKKKNSVANINSSQAQQQVSSTISSFSNSNAQRGLNSGFQNFQIQNQNSLSGQGGTTAIKAFNNQIGINNLATAPSTANVTQNQANGIVSSPLLQSQLTSGQNSHRQLQSMSSINNYNQSTPVQSSTQQNQKIPSTLQMSSIDKSNQGLQGRRNQQKSNSINISNLEELIQMNQTIQTGQAYQSNMTATFDLKSTAEKPLGVSKLSKEVDELISKQKAQLDKDRAKLQQNQNFFSNNFASTLNGSIVNHNSSIQQGNPLSQTSVIEVQSIQRELASHNASVNQPAQTERVYETSKFSSNCFNQKSSTQNQPVIGSITNRTQSSNSSSFLPQSTHSQHKNLVSSGASHSNIIYGGTNQKQIHSQRYSNSNSQVNLQSNISHKNNETLHHNSSSALNPCITNNTITLNALSSNSAHSNSHHNILQVDATLNQQHHHSLTQTVQNPQPSIIPSLKLNPQGQTSHINFQQPNALPNSSRVNLPPHPSSNQMQPQMQKLNSYREKGAADRYQVRDSYSGSEGEGIERLNHERTIDHVNIYQGRINFPFKIIFDEQ